MADAMEKTDYFTYSDYVNFPGDIRYELIDGEPYMMSSPSDWHQKMVMDISGQLWTFFKGKKCQVRIAPLDVRLFPKADESDDVVVQPDIMVICDNQKLSDGKACKGAPDFIVEVISPGTKKKDLGVKKNIYLEAGVREYWVIAEELVIKHTLVNGTYAEVMYPILIDPVDVAVDAFDGCVVRFEE